MLFIEKKIDTGFEYFTEEFLGTFTFKCSEKIPSSTLDTLVLAISKSPETTEGEIDYKGLHIDYAFERKDMWEEDDEALKDNK